MRINREEVAQALERIEQRRGTVTPINAGSARLLEQAEVSVDRLTGDPVWDIFAQRIQVLLNDALAKQTAVFKAMTQGPNLPGEALHALHKEILALQGSIDAWESVLRLPKEIKSAAANAKATPKA